MISRHSPSSTLIYSFCAVLLAGCPAPDNQQSTTFRYQMGPPKAGSLHEAVMLGNTPGVKKFIAEKQSKKVLEEEQEGFTPLHYAVYYGRTVIAQLLIDASVNLEQGDQQGATALHWSIKTDYDGLLNTNSSRNASPQTPKRPDFDAITKLLLDKGAKVDAKDNQGRRPLHEAARKDRPKAAELLIDRKADPDVKDNQGRTPLHGAVLNTKTRITEILIEKGANPDIKDKQGRTPLHDAVLNSKTGSTEILVEKGANPDVKDNQGRTPLHGAVLNSKTGITEILIAKGANPDIQDNQGRTPLHDAVLNSKTRSTEILVAKGANPDVKDNQGRTPLHGAVLNSKTGITEILIAKGANPDVKDNQGRTPLHDAVLNSKTGITEILIAKGANPDVKDNQGRTPLHDAVLNSKTGITKVLIAKGANPDIQDKSGKSARQYAKEQKQEKILYSFAFDVESHNAQYKSGVTYTRAVIEKNKPTGDKRAITYASSDPSIATVDANGVVSFVAPGTVIITATKPAETGHDEATASYELTIAPLYSFAFDVKSHNAQYRSGATHTRAVIETNKPTGDKRAITYASSDPSIATVNANGVVSFVAPGTVTITATKAAEGEYPKATASYELTIAYKFAFDIESFKFPFTAGTTPPFTVVEKGKPAGDKRAIIYTSSDASIATVDANGVVSFVAPGTVTITATKAAQGEYPKATASYELTITKMKPANKAELFTEIRRVMTAYGNEVDLNYIDTSGITDMSFLFSSSAYTSGKNLYAFNGDISTWDVSKVTNMKSMFAGAKSFNQDISGWDVSKVTNMKAMFHSATSFNQKIPKWDVSKVTNMELMFFGATSFNQDISRWDVSKVTNMRSMFNSATSFKHNLDAWGSRINNAVKAGWWKNMYAMFKKSGLSDNLPSWCSTTCIRQQS